MPTENEVESLLSEARNDPDRIIKFKLESGGLQVSTNSKLFGTAGAVWAYVMADLLEKRVVTEIVPGVKWQLQIIPEA
jgi:hypothetical protein